MFQSNPRLRAKGRALSRRVQWGVLQHGRPRGAACFSHKPLGMNWSPWREKAHASASACLKAGCSPAVHSLRSQCCPCLPWRCSGSCQGKRTPIPSEGPHLLATLANSSAAWVLVLQSVKLKSTVTWQFPIISQALPAVNFSGGDVSLSQQRAPDFFADVWLPLARQAAGCHLFVQVSVCHCPLPAQGDERGRYSLPGEGASSSVTLHSWTTRNWAN